jgi:hypothetical protein
MFSRRFLWEKVVFLGCTKPLSALHKKPCATLNKLSKISLRAVLVILDSKAGTEVSVVSD